MKANQHARGLRNSDQANTSIVNVMITIVLAAALVGVVADMVASGQASANLTATQKTLLGLLTLGFILVPLILIFRRASGGRD